MLDGLCFSYVCRLSDFDHHDQSAASSAIMRDWHRLSPLPLAAALPGAANDEADLLKRLYGDLGGSGNITSATELGILPPAVPIDVG